MSTKIELVKIEIPRYEHADSWIGVDLDGTLAMHEKWVDEFTIGEPVPLMVERVKAWLAAGLNVKIFTARVCPNPPEQKQKDLLRIYQAIEIWCEKHIGQKLEVTCRKDYKMVQLWDDRAIEVQRNTGRIRPKGAWV
jgi:hypothetical protein